MRKGDKALPSTNPARQGFLEKMLIAWFILPGFAYLYSLKLSRDWYAKSSRSFSEHHSGQSWPVSKKLITFDPYAYIDKILYTYTYNTFRFHLIISI